MSQNVGLMPPRWLAWTGLALAVAGVGYGLWWRNAASLLDSTLNDVQRQARAQGAVMAWDSVKTSGFPLRLKAVLAGPNFADTRAGIAWNAQNLSVEVLPWSLSQINFTTKGPQELKIGPSIAIAGVTKESGLSLLFRSDGMPKQLDFAIQGVDAAIRRQGATDISVKGEILALHWRIDPNDADAKDGRDYDAAINAKSLALSGVELPFGQDIADLKLQATLRGVPALQGVDGAMDLIKWRANGAPITIHQLNFVSGGVDIQGQGDLALGADGTLQGQLNLTVGGFDKIVALLSKAGAIPAEAKSTLFVTSTMLAATGAKIPMPLVFKDGKAFLGPAHIGPAPRLLF